LFDDKQEIPDGSRDFTSRRFTKQINEDGDMAIVPNDELNSYGISALYQRVQLYRIYNNSSFVLGNGNLLVNLGYQYSHRREYTHPEQPQTPGLNLQLNTYTYDTKYNFSFGNEYETSFGINGMYQTNSLGAGTDFPIPAYHQFDIGPFAFIKKSYGKLDVSAGARFDSRSFTGEAAYVDNTDPAFPSLYTGPNPTTAANVDKQFDPLKKTFSGFSGSFGATYNFSNEFLIKGNIARGFRAPSIAELSANGADPGSQIYHTGNENFVPEFSLQEDLGAFLTLPNVSASAELFNNNISNYIFQQQVLNPDGSPVETQGYNTFTYVQSQARIYGGEVNLDIHPIKWLHFENSLTLTYGENKGSGGHVADSLKYLPFIPPLHTHTELRGNFDKGFGIFKNVYGFVGLDHYAAQDRFFSAYGTETYTAGYNLLSAGIGGNVVNKTGKTLLKLFIEGTNLGNVSYQSNMSRLKYFDPNGSPAGITPGIFNMGRNISFKVIVPFGS
jgi:iron complex outermembrane receptor protein